MVSTESIDFNCRFLIMTTHASANTLINKSHTFNKTGDACTSISVKLDGYLADNVVYKTVEIGGVDYTEIDSDNSTILYTDNYTYTVPEAKQWDHPPSSTAHTDLSLESINVIEDETDYINKKNSIIADLEAV